MKYTILFLPCSMAFSIHVAVILRDLGAGPVRHAPGSGRVLRVVTGPPGERRLAVKL